MNNFLKNAVQNIDEEQARQLFQQLDEEQVAEAIGWVLDEQLLPHLEDIRQQAVNDDDPYDVRAYFSNMSEAEQEEAFDDALENLVTAVIECRSNPSTGFPMLKSQLRDPYTAEALLLIFENDDHIDPEYSAQMKEFAGKHLKWASAMVFPEMYTQAEREEALQNYGPQNRG